APIVHPPPKKNIIDSFHINLPTSIKPYLAPVGIVLAILLVGVGGTYAMATILLAPKPVPKVAQTNTIGAAPLVTPTDTPTPTLAVTPTATPTPTFISPAPVASIPAGWLQYNFSAVNMSFYYPPTWFVDLSATSGAPNLHVQNFTPSGSLPTTNIKNQYAFLINRYDEVGIASVSGLLNSLAAQASQPVTLEGVNMGTVSVLSGGPKLVSGYQAYERMVAYSNFPGNQYYELYVLDGKTNVIRFFPELDTANGATYFNQLITTISFK
ncbi:MAG: hypothetical protein ACM3IJ_05305, partial [Candidatus Levyibacteriota bacterium]